jgi:hypothetical protein
LLPLALLVSLPARAQVIDLPGTQPHDLDGAEPLASSTGCADCHFERDSSASAHMPSDTWAGSMMANAMRDPLFLAALTVAEQDRPGVGDYCLRCHTPPGFVGGRTRSSDPAARAGLGALLSPTDLEGVTCDSCHRMTETANASNAQYVLSPTDVRFGPYDDAFSMRHGSARSTWTGDPRLCGTCHEITNPTQPLRRADGSDTGARFPLDTTYSEWRASDFARAGEPGARTCQDCHMPRVSGSAFNSTHSTAMERAMPRRHDFVGGNVWAIRMLAQMRGDPALAGFYDPEMVPYYERAALRAEDSLRSAATLEIRRAPASAAPGERVEIEVRLTNQTGHKLPTGYADARRVWLQVELVDASGAVTPVSGAYDVMQAHLDTRDPQLRIYEALHGRVGVGVEEHIALHDTVVRDTRLPPRGFRPTEATMPVGRDYAGGAGGALRHWDDAKYTVDIPATARGPLTVRVRALYQATTREYVEFLERENHTDDRGRELRRRWEDSGRAAPFVMASASAEIAAVGAVGDGGMGDGGGRARPGGCGCRTVGRTGEGRVGAVGMVLGVVGVGAAVRGRRRRARG